MPSLTSNLTTLLGTFFQVHGQMIMAKIKLRSRVLELCQPYFSDVAEGQEFTIPRYDMQEVLQNFQSVSTPKGGLTVDGEKIVQRRHKIQIPINPEELVGKWEGQFFRWFNERGKTNSEKAQAFILFVMQKLIAQIDHDRTTKQIYKGVYVAATPGVASPAENAMDGFGKKIADAITATKITPFAMGSWTAADTFEYFEEFVSLMPPEIWSVPMVLLADPTHIRNFQLDRRNANGYLNQLGQDLKIDFSQVELIADPSMIGRNRIWATPKENLAVVYHRTTSMENMRVYDEMYNSHLLADFHMAVGFSNYEYVYCNDQV